MKQFRRLLPLWMIIGFLLVHLPPQLAAQTENRAALVVNLGGGNVQTRCVTFSEPQITGYDLLLRSGLNPVVDVQGMGTLVCSIGGVGCPADNCLCQCSGGGECVYWSYWHRINGNWQYSQAGAGIYPITDGVVDGWSWGSGSINEATPPPNFAFEDVCQVPATATAVPPTNTPIPTNTPTVAATPPPEIAFTADAATLNAGACTNLRWRTAYISALYLNGDGVTGEEVREVCPTQTEVYTLRVVYPGGEESRSLTITVLPAPETPSPTATTVRLATAVPPAQSSPAAVAAATTADLEPTQPSPVAQVAEPTAAPAETTAETIWITVPPQPTDTAVPAAAVVAALPATPQIEASPVSAVESQGQVAKETAVSWVSYIAFFSIILILSLLILWANRKTRTS